MIGRYLGAPNRNAPEHIDAMLWPVISREILRQCDGLDGVKDGYLTEPDDCDFDPETLLCADGAVDGCLSQVQVEVLRKIYSPIVGSRGQLLYPRYDPGAESSSIAQVVLGGGILSFLTVCIISFQETTSYGADILTGLV
jgi:hypothetical protein